MRAGRKGRPPVTVDGNPVHFGIARAQAAHILRCAYKRLDVVLGRQRVRENEQKVEPFANFLGPGFSWIEVGAIWSHFGVLT